MVGKVRRINANVTISGSVEFTIYLLWKCTSPRFFGFVSVAVVFAVFSALPFTGEGVQGFCSMGFVFRIQ